MWLKTPLMKSRKRCRTKISASGRKGRANYGAPFLYADKRNFSGPGMRQQQDRAGGIARRCVCSTCTQAGPEGKETCQNQCGGSAECARPPDPGESPESRLPGRPDWQVADRAQSDGGCVLHGGGTRVPCRSSPPSSWNMFLRRALKSCCRRLQHEILSGHQSIVPIRT